LSAALVVLTFNIRNLSLQLSGTIMRILFFVILFLTVQSCDTKKYTKTRLLPQGIKSFTEEIYVVNDQKKLLLAGLCCGYQIIELNKKSILLSSESGKLPLVRDVIPFSVTSPD